LARLTLTPPDPPLSDGVVTLRLPDAERDTPTLPVIAGDPEIQQRVLGGVPPPYDPDVVFRDQLGRWEKGTDAFFSVDADGHDQRVGVTRVLFGLVDPFDFAEVGYFLLPDGRGRGYATRTVRLVARWVFDDLGIGRLQARTEPSNDASARVLERVGFRREGVARGGHVLPVSRERIDTVMWSLLPGDLAS
jgi:RimJ/RimL family protein N-acetyltransferase